MVASGREVAAARNSPTAVRDYRNCVSTIGSIRRRTRSPMSGPRRIHCSFSRRSGRTRFARSGALRRFVPHVARTNSGSPLPIRRLTEAPCRQDHHLSYMPVNTRTRMHEPPLSDKRALHKMNPHENDQGAVDAVDREIAAAARFGGRASSGRDPGRPVGTHAPLTCGSAGCWRTVGSPSPASRTSMIGSAAGVRAPERCTCHSGHRPRVTTARRACHIREPAITPDAEQDSIDPRGKTSESAAAGIRGAGLAARLPMRVAAGGSGVKTPFDTGSADDPFPYRGGEKQFNCWPLPAPCLEGGARSVLSSSHGCDPRPQRA